MLELVNSDALAAGLNSPSTPGRELRTKALVVWLAVQWFAFFRVKRLFAERDIRLRLRNAELQKRREMGHPAEVWAPGLYQREILSAWRARSET